MGLIEEARDWLADCVWADMEPEDFEDVPGWQIMGAVERHYQGGWRAFVYTSQHATTLQTASAHN